jgi:predicted nucleic acid-binding protein
MLLDTNIVIYAAKGQYPEVRKLLREHDAVVSVVSYVEALGFSRLPAQEKADIERFFRRSKMLRLTRPVMKQAVRLRQTRRMRLGDSIIAATALVHGQTLVTRNVADFRWISGLGLMNPVT